MTKLHYKHLKAQHVKITKILLDSLFYHCIQEKQHHKYKLVSEIVKTSYGTEWKTGKWLL